MTQLSLIFDFLFFALIIMGLAGGYLLCRRIQAFRATLPELGKTISTLNASIVQAEATIAQLQALANQPMAPAPKPRETASPRETLQRGGIDSLRNGGLEALLASIARNKPEARSC